MDGAWSGSRWGKMLCRVVEGMLVWNGYFLLLFEDDCDGEVRYVDCDFVIWVVCDMELIYGITTWRQPLFHSRVPCMALITWEYFASQIFVPVSRISSDNDFDKMMAMALKSEISTPSRFALLRKKQQPQIISPTLHRIALLIFPVLFFSP